MSVCVFILFIFIGATIWGLIGTGIKLIWDLTIYGYVAHIGDGKDSFLIYIFWPFAIIMWICIQFSKKIEDCYYQNYGKRKYKKRGENEY